MSENASWRKSSALRALQRVLTLSRHLAYTGTEAKEIAGILDEAEYLVAILLHEEEDAIGEFRRVLQHIGAKFPAFAGVVADFDEANQQLPASSETLPALTKTA